MITFEPIRFGVVGEGHGLYCKLTFLMPRGAIIPAYMSRYGLPHVVLYGTAWLGVPTGKL